jgi:VIT1/CCC1 family predicted Fe2+/Mn2+ transporter
VGQPKPSGRARFTAWMGRRIGPRFLLPFLLQEEGREVKSYLDLYREAPQGAAGPTALNLAIESKGHAETLAGLVKGASPEPWHKTGAGGFLRNVVYGFNDGLTANFGLVAGMVGAQASLGSAGHAVVVAGLAGMMADALSMGSSGYLAAKSEREVFEHEIAMEREEIRLMPELEREELSLIYQAKGIPAAQAGELATAVMADPVKALEEKVREELKIGDATSTPMREGWVTGVATAFGAFIPVAPLLVSTEPWAIWVSFGVSMLSHFAVGAARSFFTGRSVFRSGLDMFLVGLGVAVVGYLMGDWIVTIL